MAEPEHPIRRKSFTRLQELQAEYVGYVTDAHRTARLQIPSFPIDNVSHEVVSDRDDGVFVEAEHRNGGYRVHVTIADVAAHIRPGSPLAEAAWQRGFTLYGGSWTDPMFPNGPEQRLEEKMSLEHNRERLGLTVSITLDKNYRPVHTSFMPVITHPDNSSYQRAHERMRSEPQFQLMHDIAQGVKKHYFHGHDVPLEEIFSHRTLRRLQNQPDQLQAMEMVATYMLLANNCTADFARKANLPFMYRNFDETAGDTHATYGTKPGRHTALERMGLKGAYCHFTSPIRRAPDYFNAAMIHYAIDALSTIEKRIAMEFPGIDQKAVHRGLWAHGGDIVQLLGENGGPRVLQRVGLQRLLTEVIADKMPPRQQLSENRLRAMVSTLQIKPPPYTRDELQHYADNINALARSPEVRAVERQNERYEQSVDRIETIQAADKESLAYLSPEKFSSLLHAAAVTGQIPRNLFEEARERIQSGNFNMGVDGFTIFVEAAQPGVSRWTALKGLIATQLKKDPSAVNGMWERLKQHIAPAEISEHQSALEGDIPEGRDEPTHTPAILFRMAGPGMPALAAPFYSVGHDQRAARSHAKYSFLEHYAFGQLQPVEQTAVPNLLYADLDMAGAKKRELLDRMAESIGATLEFSQTETKTGRIVQTITAQGGDLREPITVEADEPTMDAALSSAMRRMFRDEHFKLAVSREQQIARELLNPQSVLADMVASRGGDIHFERITKSQGPHRAHVRLVLNGEMMQIEGEGPNLDRAERDAAVKALEMLGWQLDGLTLDSAVKSWVTETQRPPAGEGRSYHAGK